MRYKVHNEPMYVFECRALLECVINGKSVRENMEKSITLHGAESMRKEIESLYMIAFEMEDYFKSNICLNLPGFENTGQEIAKFLYKKWEHAENAPIDAVINYATGISYDTDDKAVSIICIIGVDYLEKNVWSFEEMDARIPPPTMEDSRFFTLINSSSLEPDDKLKALKLYYDYDIYRTYADALLKHATELLKSKVHVYTNDIEAYTDFIEKDFQTNDGLFLKEILGFEPKDDLVYNIYPGTYLINGCALIAPALVDPMLVIGIRCAPLFELLNNVESEKSRAERFLKCLSDSTKKNILQLLKNESLYGSQLADKLNCTGANISQHMGELTSLDVVHVKKVNNRIYYHLNKEAIHKYLDVAKGFYV